MDFLIADTFTDSFARLTGDEQKAVKTTLSSGTSRASKKPKQGHIAVKVINHLGDEVTKVFKV